MKQSGYSIPFQEQAVVLTKVDHFTLSLSPSTTPIFIAMVKSSQL